MKTMKVIGNPFVLLYRDTLILLCEILDCLLQNFFIGGKYDPQSTNY